MTKVFPDVSDFPVTDAPVNPRAGMGGNNPPLEESIVMEFDSALREYDGLLERIDQMTERAATARRCANDDDVGAMGDFIRQCSAAVKVIEDVREVFNRPLINARSALKARADALSGKATEAGNKVRVLMNEYLAKKEADRRAEVARLAEIERLAEVERQRVIREAQIEAERVAEVERKRLQAIADEEARIERERRQAIADAEAQAERERLQAIEDTRAAAEQREAASVEVVAEVVEVVAEVVEVAPEPVYVSEPEPVFVTAAPTKGPIRGNLGTSVSVTETWDVKVENVRQVPDIFLKHPSVIEALEKVIRPSVRSANGMREIKGCRIFSTLGSSVRG